MIPKTVFSSRLFPFTDLMRFSPRENVAPLGFFLEIVISISLEWGIESSPWAIRQPCAATVFKTRSVSFMYFSRRVSAWLSLRGVVVGRFSFPVGRTWTLRCGIATDCPRACVSPTCGGHGAESVGGEGDGDDEEAEDSAAVEDEDEDDGDDTGIETGGGSGAGDGDVTGKGDGDGAVVATPVAAIGGTGPLLDATVAASAVTGPGGAGEVTPTEGYTNTSDSGEGSSASTAESAAAPLPPVPSGSRPLLVRGRDTGVRPTLGPNDLWGLSMTPLSSSLPTALETSLLEASPSMLESGRGGTGGGEVMSTRAGTGGMACARISGGTIGGGGSGGRGGAARETSVEIGGYCGSQTSSVTKWTGRAVSVGMRVSSVGAAFVGSEASSLPLRSVSRCLRSAVAAAAAARGDERVSVSSTGTCLCMGLGGVPTTLSS